MAKRQIASTGEFVEDKAPKQVATKAPPLLQVKIHSPFKVYFEGQADTVSAENNTGPFDILPEHHNFITLLNPCVIIVRGRDGERRIRIARGIMHVRENCVNIFLDV
jgi:F0F1-type ATP synthase epsilon subunit